jgi:hypothetical protein
MLLGPQGIIILSPKAEVKHRFGTTQGLRQYASKDKPKRIKIVKEDDGGGKMHISFASKAFAIAEFDDFDLMVSFLSVWKQAHKAKVEGLK